MSLRYAIYVIIFALAILIQWPLWFGKGGVIRMHDLEKEVAALHDTNERLRTENNYIATEIESLENGRGAVEEHARMQLGMIRSDELLFRFVLSGVKDTKNLSSYEVPKKRTAASSIFRPKNKDLYIEGDALAEKEPAKRVVKRERKKR